MRLGVLQGLQPCTCFKLQQRQKPKRHSVGWRVSVGLRGRREPIHGGLVAASMRLTPRKPTVPRLRQIPAAVGGCRPLVGTCVGYRMNHPRMAWIHWQRRLLECAAIGRCRPWSTQSERSKRPAFAFLFLFPWLAAHGNCQRWGGVGSRGCPRHGSRGQAPMDGFTASPANPPRPTKRGILNSATSHEGLSRWRRQTPGASGCPLRLQCTALRLRCGCHRKGGRSPRGPS
ncbi:MAG: hypothetical protein GAK31_02119 [Stenotrophomonas maltophilia]|uniref:Uncharacterized protein n=1 Tax=Stenotrophomonas maltophilia TaxID=40324 RepID=A0A7V8FFM2_STEMA|nr:MAG: hypothetical protein GAK31_02119 [Stenotrophomonas maltophilia]